MIKIGKKKVKCKKEERKEKHNITEEMKGTNIRIIARKRKRRRLKEKRIKRKKSGTGAGKI